MQPRRRCSAGISADPLHPPASSVVWRPRTTIRTPGMAHGARCLGFLLPDLSGWWPAAGQGRCTRGTGKTETDGNQGALGAAHGGARRSDGGALRRWNRRRTEGAASMRLRRRLLEETVRISLPCPLLALCSVRAELGQAEPAHQADSSRAKPHASKPSRQSIAEPSPPPSSLQSCMKAPDFYFFHMLIYSVQHIYI